MHLTAECIHGRHVLHTWASDRRTNIHRADALGSDPRGLRARLLGDIEAHLLSDGRGTHECMAVASRVQVARSPRRANDAARCPWP